MQIVCGIKRAFRVGLPRSDATRKAVGRAKQRVSRAVRRFTGQNSVTLPRCAVLSGGAPFFQQCAFVLSRGALFYSLVRRFTGAVRDFSSWCGVFFASRSVFLTWCGILTRGAPFYRAVRGSSRKIFYFRQMNRRIKSYGKQN